MDLKTLHVNKALIKYIVDFITYSSLQYEEGLNYFSGWRTIVHLPEW